jgi:hypothetical protein
MGHEADCVRRALVMAGAAVLACGVAGAAAAEDVAAPAAAPAEATTAPTREQMLEEIRALRERVDRLTEAQAGGARAERAEVDGTADAVLRDADRRSQLLQAQGFTAGYTNGKFLIQSEDGSFVLNPNFQFQFRAVANHAEDAQADGDDETESGLEIRRMKFSFDGNAFTKDLAYKFQWAVNRNNGNTVLEDAWVRYKFADRWFVRGGQFVEPLFHEQLTSSRRMQAVERSLLNETLGTGGESYVQGVSLFYDDGNALRAEVAYHDGVQNVNTSFVDGGGTALLGIVNPDFGVAGRAEYKLMGDWKQYDDFTAMGNKTDLLVVGAGADYTEAGDASVLFHTFDVQWEPQAVNGLSLYAAYVGVYRDFGDPGGLDASPYDFGFLVQGGYMLSPRVEVFGRYDYINLDGDAPGTLGIAAADAGSDDLHEFTVGMNYFLKGHAAKFTVDLTWLPNGSPVGASSAGIVGQASDDDQFVLRGQFQLLL